VAYNGPNLVDFLLIYSHLGQLAYFLAEFSLNEVLFEVEVLKFCEVVKCDGDAAHKPIVVQFQHSQVLELPDFFGDWKVFGACNFTVEVVAEVEFR